MSDQTGAVGVVLWTSQEFGRSVLSGVIEHYRGAQGVDVAAIPADGGLRCLSLAELDGLVVALNPKDATPWLERVTCPTVVVPRLAVMPEVVTVTCDQGSTGEQAARYFYAMRIGNVALCADTRECDPAECERTFHSKSQAYGMEVQPACLLQRDAVRRIDGWLARLPTPVGVFACDDLLARKITERAIRRGLRVPEDIAILGFGDSPITCRTGGITLSSVMLPSGRFGKRAAAALDAMRIGRRHPNVAIAPTGIVSRASTDTVNVEDPLVATVVRQIRSRFLDAPATTLLAHEQGIARRTLDARFRAHMGCTIHEEMTRCRIDWALIQLADESISIKQIAGRLGVQLSNFSRLVRLHTGMSPRQYRDRLLS